MPTINGAKLPDIIKLSDHISNTYEAVRVNGLRKGQTLIVDVTLDGGYKHPDTPVKAEWVGDVREGVHTALLSISDGTGFTVNFVDGTELQQSRGRQLSISKCSGFTVNDAYGRGAATAGIALQDCTGFTFNRGITIYTGNYQTNKNVGPNWPGSIKMQRCYDYVMNDCISVDHMGNGMTPTECKNGTWNDLTCIDVTGANVYINASPDHFVTGGLCFGSATRQTSAYVTNSEKENEGVSEDACFEGCYCFDTETAFGAWGNQKKEGLTLDLVSVVGSVFVAKEGFKVHPNAGLQKLDKSGTLYLPSVPDATLAKLREQGAALKALALKHAPWPAIAAQRAALIGTLEGLRKDGPVEPPVDPPVDPPTDDTEKRIAALEATVAGLVAQQAALGGAQERMSVEWVGFMDRVRTLAG